MTSLCRSQSTRSSSESGLTGADSTRKDRYVDQKHPNHACLQTTWWYPSPYFSHTSHCLNLYLSRPVCHEIPFAMRRSWYATSTFVARTLVLHDPVQFLPKTALILSLCFMYKIRHNALALTLVITPVLPVPLILLHKAVEQAGTDIGSLISWLSRHCVLQSP